MVYLRKIRTQNYCVLLEKLELIMSRRRYLIDIKRYHREDRPIYFLNETWVNARDITSQIWSDKTVQLTRYDEDAHFQNLSTEAVNSTGKRKRLIVSHIESEDRFIYFW